MSGFAYLACPYWHPLQEVRDAREKAITLVSAALLLEGEVNFCPIAHGNAQKRHHRSIKARDGYYEFWMKADLPFMNAATHMIEIQFPGWENSAGLQFERKYFMDTERIIQVYGVHSLGLPLDLINILGKGQ